MTEYTVIFEWTGNNYSAYVPDLPGCISTGLTIEDTEISIQEAIELYIDTLKEDQQRIPQASTRSKVFAVQV